jgi:hypothetical protein
MIYDEMNDEILLNRARPCHVFEGVQADPHALPLPLCKWSIKRRFSSDYYQSSIR